MRRPSTKVILLHFEETYFLQNRLRALSWKEYDLRPLRGVKYQCSMDNMCVIERTVKDIPDRSVVLMGSGDYHYISYLLLKRLRMPFDLVIFDNHVDAYPPQQGYIGCHSWITETCRNIPMLKKVYVVGAEQPSGYSLPARVEVVPALWSPKGVDKFLKKVGHYIYISIDKDVLSPAVARTNWDQGTIPLGQFAALLKALVSSKGVLGVDICGEAGVEWKHLVGLDNSHLINERVNLEIIDILYSAQQSRTA